jgi:hypothetical protein
LSAGYRRTGIDIGGGTRQHAKLASLQENSDPNSFCVLERRTTAGFLTSFPSTDLPRVESPHADECGKMNVNAARITVLAIFKFVIALGTYQ